MTNFYNNIDKKQNIMRNKLFGSKSQFVNRKSSIVSLKSLFAAIFTLLMVFCTPLAMKAQTYELVTASQTDWSGTYVLVGPWNTTTGYAFDGEVDTEYHDGGITAVTIDGTSISSIGDAAVLTIAKSSYNSNYYSIRINGGDYLGDGQSGMETSSTDDTQYTIWTINYTSDGIQIYNPIWNGGPYYLYFVVAENTSTSSYSAWFTTCTEGAYTTEGYNFYYEFPVLYKNVGDDLTIGSGTSKNSYIPTYTYYNYSLTQQIYTSAEVGDAGTITAIAFQVANSKPATRTIDIYMSHTSTSSFSGTSAWISQSTSYRVFSGSVSFQSSGWTTITLDTPFEYDGTSNLLLTVDDNTGTYISGSSNNPSFYVYSTSSNRAIYKYNDGTNYNPASMTTAGTLLTYNNQIKLTVERTTYTLTTSANPSAGGTVTPNGTSTHNGGASVQVNATANTGYTFSGWTLDGASAGSTNPYTLTMNDDHILVANFTSLSQYTITVNATQGGTGSGGGTYYQGEQATLTATANSGYAFAGWQLNGSTVSTDNPYTITVNGNATYTAVFEALAQHNITVTQATGGTISASSATAYMGDVITLTATPETGYFFAEWIVRDANNQTVTVTNNQFTMPNSNVTVTATFTQGFQVTLVQTANGTISADQTTNLRPGDHVTLTATPNNDCVFIAWYAFKTGNPRDVVAVISNTTIIMPASDVTVQAIFVTEEEHEQTVGGGTSTSNYLPTNVYYNYSLTQQIYTATEIGYNGRITAIAFKATSNISNARSLDIYMSHTDKTAFSSTSDWEVMGSVALVYSGSVSFAYNDWTTITLNTPFEYDGTSNLNICVVDKTGSYESGSRSFSTYSTSANRALYKYDDNTNYSTYVGYSNQLSGLSGSYSTSNNQIVFTIKAPGSAESLTISPDAINDFSYVEGHGPSGTHKLDIVGVDLENNITITAPTNFEVCLTEDGTYTSSLTIPRETGSKANRSVTTWDFEDGLQGWTVNDADGDGYNWAHNTSFGGHNESTGIVYSQSYDNSAGVLTPDNWLISPQVELGGSFSMWAHPQQAAYPAEHFGIYVSTTGTNPSDFTLLDEWTLTSGNWKQFSVDLGLYTGQQGYIAVRHFNCSDQFYINVDDFKLDTDATISIEMPVTITTASVFVRMKGNLSAGNYSGTLTASAGSGSNVNRNVSLSGEVIATYDITLSANPTAGGSVGGAGTYAAGTEITVSARTNSHYNFENWTENGTVVSTEASYTFTVTQDRDLVANFEPITYNITYDLAGGSVSPANPTSYTIETQTFMLTNPTRTGYTFAGWTGTGLGGATQTVTIAQGSTGNRNYTANWTIDTYNITYDLAGGSVSPANPATYNFETATFTLNNPTRTGYTFAGWTGTDLGGATTTVTIAQGSTGDRSYTAIWTENSYAVTFYNGGHGTIKVAGTTVANGGTASVNHFTTKTLAVTANTGYTFNGWTKTGSVNIGNTSNASTTITATATGGTVTATWVPTSYNITYNLDGGSVATDNPTNYTIETATFTLNNPTKEGYTFAGWTGTGIGSATTTVTITQGSTGDRSYTATWTINNYQIAVSANPSGTVSGGGNYNHFSECTVTASPSTNYCFKNWTENGAVVSTSASYTFTVTGARTLVANFTHYLEVSDIATVDYCVTGAHAAVSATPTAGSDDYTYTWQKYNGSSWVAAPDASNSDRYTPPYTTTGTVSYRVSVADNNGCAGHNSVVKEFSVKVSDVPSIALSASPVCSGSTLTLEPSVENNGKDVSSSSYQISANNSDWSSFTNGSAVTNEQNGYYIKYTATNGCGSSSQTVQITVNSLPTASIDGPTSVCALKSETIVASGAGDGGSYSWSNDLGTGASKTVAITSNANYTVTVTDANECSVEKSISMTVSYPGDLPMTNVVRGHIWTGYQSSDWDDSRNWLVFTGGGSGYETATEAPTSSDNVIIRSGSTCISNQPTINTSSTVSELIVRNGRTLAFDAEASHTLSVTGDAVIESGATVTFDNKDTLNVAGNLTLSGSFSFPTSPSDTTPALRLGGNLTINSGASLGSAGTLVFAGNGPQTVTNNNPGDFTIANNVRLNMHRSRAGVPHTVFPDGTIFSKTTIFEYGIMDGNVTFDGTGRAIVCGDYESYASGSVKKIGSDNKFTFPTGDDNVLGTITAKIRTGQSAVAKFHHKATGFTIEDGYPRWWNVADMCGADPFNHVSNFEYWDFNSTEALSGVMFRTKSATPEEHFHDPSEYPDPDNPDNLIQIAVYDRCWQNTGGELSITPDFTDITISGVGVSARGTRSGAITTLGSKDPSVVLPIELLSFTATCNGKYAELAWSTASERNNDYFVIERSEDAKDFVEVGRVAGAGNSIEQLDYTYNDYGIHGGDNYYRLVQVDYDGTRTVSEIVVANCVDAVAEDPEVMAYPNPFNGELTIVLDNFDNRPATIEVYDMLGKLIYIQKADAPQNSYETILNLSNLPTGAYNVRVSTADFVINRQIVKN